MKWRLALGALALFWTLGAAALSMEEAIDKALLYSQNVERQAWLLKQAQSETQKSWGSFYPEVNLKYQTYGSNRSDNRGESDGSYALLELRYNLFNGLSDRFSLQSAKALEEAQEFALEASRQDLILLVKNSYIALLKARENLKVSQESVRLLEEQRRESENFYQVGYIAKNTLLKVEVELSNAKQTLLEKESALAYAKRDLERYVGERVVLEGVKEVGIESALETSEMHLREKMWANRSELRYLAKNREAKRYEQRASASNYYPKVDLVGEYRSYGDSASLGNRNGTYNDRTEGRLEASWNLFNGFSDQHNQEAKRYAVLAMDSQIVETKRELELQLFEALEQYRLAQNAHEVAKLALEQAKENYRITLNRYKERMETSSELLDAELLLTKAKSSLLEKRYSIATSIASLQRVVEAQ